MIKVVKLLGEMNDKDDESDEDGDIDVEDPGDDFVPITKLKRMACLAHTVQLVYKNICKYSTVSSTCHSL